MAYDIDQIWFVAQTQDVKHGGTDDEFILNFALPGEDLLLLRSDASSEGKYSQDISESRATQFSWENLPAGQLTTENIEAVRLYVDGDDSWAVYGVWVMGRFYDDKGNKQFYVIAANPAGNFCLSTNPDDCDGTAEKSYKMNLRHGPC